VADCAPFILFLLNATTKILISIRIVDPDPYWESGSRGKKMKKFQWKNALFSNYQEHTILTR
jgi:hypothetical protein